MELFGPLLLIAGFCWGPPCSHFYSLLIFEGGHPMTQPISKGHKALVESKYMCQGLNSPYNMGYIHPPYFVGVLDITYYKDSRHFSGGMSDPNPWIRGSFERENPIASRLQDEVWRSRRSFETMHREGSSAGGSRRFKRPEMVWNGAIERCGRRCPFFFEKQQYKYTFL